MTTFNKLEIIQQEVAGIYLDNPETRRKVMKQMPDIPYFGQGQIDTFEQKAEALHNMAFPARKRINTSSLGK
jgi:hypothetical protein